MVSFSVRAGCLLVASLILLAGCAQPRPSTPSSTTPSSTATKYLGGPQRIQEPLAPGECGPIPDDVRRRNPVEHRNESGHTRITRLATLTNHEYGGAPHFDVDCETLRVDVRATWESSVIRRVNITLEGCEFFEGVEGASPLAFAFLDHQIRGHDTCRPVFRPVNTEPVLPPTTFSWRAHIEFVRDFSGG